MEFEEIESNKIEKDKLFNHFSNQTTYEKINIDEKINNQDQYFTKFIIQTLGKDAIKRKPESLIKLENQLKSYFFGKKGTLIDLIPKLKAELLKKERKKDDRLDEKIEIGDLVYLNQLYDKKISLEKRASINQKRSELLLSNNFSRTKKFKTKKINSKDKDKYSFFNYFNQKTIKKIKSISISPKENKLNNSIKKLSNNKIDISQDNSNSKIPIFQKAIPIKSYNYTINNSSNSISSTFYPTFRPSNSQKVINLKISNYNNIFRRKRNKINLFNCYTPEKGEKIEHYSIKKPIIFNSYLKTSNNIKLKKSASNYKTFRNEKIKILNMLNDYSLHEKNLSKSLHEIINKNKLIKTNTFNKDIETLFDKNTNIDKYFSMNDIFRKTKKNKSQKTLILHTNDSISDNKIKQLLYKSDPEKENKLTEHYFEKDNKQLNRIKQKLKHGIELIHSLENKLSLDHLKLKEKINNINYERNIINHLKKNHNNLKKKEIFKSFSIDQKKIN